MTKIKIFDKQKRLLAWFEFNKKLSEDEIESLYNNPYQMFKKITWWNKLLFNIKYKIKTLLTKGN